MKERVIDVWFNMNVDIELLIVFRYCGIIFGWLFFICLICKMISIWLDLIWVLLYFVIFCKMYINLGIFYVNKVG